VKERPPGNALASFHVRFPQRARVTVEEVALAPARSISQIARALAFAHKIEGMIRAGEVKDWADAARLAGVTRARMTQFANLLLLAPSIQVQLLDIPAFSGTSHLTERRLRKLTSFPCWARQLELSKTLLGDIHGE